LRRRRGLAALAVLFLAVSPAAPAKTESKPRFTYLVLPFEDSAPDPAREWLREGMALSLGEYLAGAGQRVVDREDRNLAMEEMSLPPGAPLTLATSIRLGRALRSDADPPNPDRLVVGRYTVDQGHLTLAARSLDLTADRAGPWKERQGSLTDLLQIQREVAANILRGDGVSFERLSGKGDEAGAEQSFPLLAYENYIRGMIDADPGRQVSFLRKAIQESPGYPKASYHLARLLVKAGKSSEAETVLARMLREPVPYRAEYHALLGSLALGTGKLSQAEEEARTSLALRETADARLLMARIEQTRGNSEEARRELDRAQSLDPDGPEIEAVRKLLGLGAGSPPKK
jgi:Tetratricopeptide repeat